MPERWPRLGRRISAWPHTLHSHNLDYFRKGIDKEKNRIKNKNNKISTYPILGDRGYLQECFKISR
jgi:hypothetical protein